MWKCPKCNTKVDDAYEICWACGTTVDGVENPGFFEEGNWEKEAPSGPEADITPESLVTLIKCSLPGEAHAIRMRLENEGIPVFLFDEFTITMDWLLSNAIGGVKVQVPEPYLERARGILNIIEEEDEPEPTEPEQEGEPTEASTDGDGADGDGAGTDGIVDLTKVPPPEEGIVEKGE